MNIMTYFESDLTSKAVCQLLVTHPYDDVVMDGRSTVSGVIPDMLLVDISTLTHDLLAQHPQTKALLIEDAHIVPEKLRATLLAYKIHGVLAPHTGFRQVWADKGSVRVLPYDTEAPPEAGNKRTTQRSYKD